MTMTNWAKREVEIANRLAEYEDTGLEPEMCSWARHFVPVDGWEATPTMLYANNASASKPVGSFHVRSCPEFVEG